MITVGVFLICQCAKFDEYDAWLNEPNVITWSVKFSNSMKWWTFAVSILTITQIIWSWNAIFKMYIAKINTIESSSWIRVCIVDIFIIDIILIKSDDVFCHGNSCSFSRNTLSNFRSVHILFNYRSQIVILTWEFRLFPEFPSQNYNLNLLLSNIFLSHTSSFTLH